MPPEARRLAQHESQAPCRSDPRHQQVQQQRDGAAIVSDARERTRAGRPANKERAQRVVGDWLVSKGLDRREFVLENGAGLSRVERLTAGGLATLLQGAFASPLMPEFVSSMPIVGVDGTMRRRQARSRFGAHQDGVTRRRARDRGLRARGERQALRGGCVYQSP